MPKKTETKEGAANAALDNTFRIVGTRERHGRLEVGVQFFDGNGTYVNWYGGSDITWDNKRLPPCRDELEAVMREIQWWIDAGYTQVLDD